MIIFYRFVFHTCLCIYPRFILHALPMSTVLILLRVKNRTKEKEMSHSYVFTCTKSKPLHSDT